METGNDTAELNKTLDEILETAHCLLQSAQPNSCMKDTLAANDINASTIEHLSSMLENIMQHIDTTAKATCPHTQAGMVDELQNRT